MRVVDQEERKRLRRLAAIGLLRNVPALELAVGVAGGTGLSLDRGPIRQLCDLLADRCSGLNSLDFVQPRSSYDGPMPEARRVFENLKRRCRGAKEVAIGSGLLFVGGRTELRDLVTSMVSQVSSAPPPTRQILAISRMLREFSAGAGDAPLLLVVSDWTYSTRFVLAHVCGIQEVMHPYDNKPIEVWANARRVRLRFERIEKRIWLKQAAAHPRDGVWFYPREWVFADHSRRDIAGDYCRLRVERADRVAESPPVVMRTDYEERLRFLELAHDQEVLDPVITNADCGFGVTHMGLTDLKVQALRLRRRNPSPGSAWIAEKLSFLLRPGDLALHHCFTTRQSVESYLCNNPGMEDLLRGYLGA
jgi:hypothetical protein